MSRQVDQLYVKHSNAKEVAETLRSYVSSIGKRFVPHPKYKLDGIEQTLRILIKKKRKFLLLPVGYWTAVWESVEDVDFADPDIARYLASELKTESLWLNLDENYNLWAFQRFSGDRLVSENFSPKSYFLGDQECQNRFRFKSCFEFADELNAKLDLPEFLTGIGAIEKRMTRNQKIVRLICKVDAKA